MKSSIAILAVTILSLTSASKTTVRAGNDKEGKVKNLEEVSEKYNDEVEVPEEELSQSIFVSDEFADEFENMVVEPFNEEEMDMDYDFEMNESEDENDRRMLWKKRHYRVLYCYHHKHGGTYYRKLQINKNEIDESKDITPDQERGLGGGYHGHGNKYSGRHGRCFKRNYYKCCFRKRNHHYEHKGSYGSDSYKGYKGSYSSGSSYSSDSYDW